MVQAKVENWLDYRGIYRYKFDPLVVLLSFISADYAAVQWLRRNTIDKLSIDFSSSRHKKRSNFVWEERKEAESDMERYLNDIPSKEIQAYVRSSHFTNDSRPCQQLSHSFTAQRDLASQP